MGRRPSGAGARGHGARGAPARVRRPPARVGRRILTGRALSGNGRIFWPAALVVLILDVVTKLLIEANLTPHVPVRVIGDFVRFTLAYNPGAAFSMSVGEYSRYVFGGFAIVALVILWRLYRSALPGERLKSLALGLAWGGAAGNLVDRFRSARGVVDFLDIGVSGWRFWTFNVADSAVTVGAVLLGIILFQEDRQQKATGG